MNVTRSEASASGGYTWSVTFITEPGDLAPLMLAGAEGLSGDAATVVLNTSRTGTSPLGGSFTLALQNGGETHSTASLSHYASAAEVKTALEALANVGNVAVKRTAASTAQGGYTQVQSNRSGALAPP